MDWIGYLNKEGTCRENLYQREYATEIAASKNRYVCLWRLAKKFVSVTIIQENWI